MPKRIGRGDTSEVRSSDLVGETIFLLFIFLGFVLLRSFL